MEKLGQKAQCPGSWPAYIYRSLRSCRQIIGALLLLAVLISEAFRVQNAAFEALELDLGRSSTVEFDMPTAERILTKDLVIASEKSSHVGWVKEVEDMYNVKLYVVDDPYAQYTVNSSTAMEVMVYLTYIIDHYDDLPNTATFHHHHEYSRKHSPKQNGGKATKYLRNIRHDTIYDSIGYRSLHCHETAKCRVRDKNAGVWLYKDQNIEDRFSAPAWLELWPDDPRPERLASACCAQFVVSRPTIQSRSKDEYISYRNWLYNIDSQPSILSINVEKTGRTQYEFNRRQPGMAFEYF